MPRTAAPRTTSIVRCLSTLTERSSSRPALESAKLDVAVIDEPESAWAACVPIFAAVDLHLCLRHSKGNARLWSRALLTQFRGARLGRLPECEMVKLLLSSTFHQSHSAPRQLRCCLINPKDRVEYDFIFRSLMLPVWVSAVASTQVAQNWPWAVRYDDLARSSLSRFLMAFSHPFRSLLVDDKMERKIIIEKRNLSEVDIEFFDN